MKQEQIKKRKNTRGENCKHCGKFFMSYMGTAGYWTKFCSISCSAKRQHANNSKNDENSNENSTLLKEYWKAYHDMLIPIEDVLNLKIMSEKFVSNKAYDKYDLFMPSNLL